MMLKTIVFLECFLLTFGINGNEMTNKEDIFAQPLTLSWETQQFVGRRSLVEEESLDELVVLRERRETGKTTQKPDQYIPSGSGEPCTTPNKCSNNAICNGTSNSYTCQCKKGFYGNGKICTDSNECARNEHGCQQKCNNYPGGFNCTCYSGYHPNKTDFEKCDDTDECSEKKTTCAQVCNNTIGSFKCSCKTGYYLGTDLKHCNEILITTVMATIGGTAVLICTLNENHVIWKKNGNIIKNNTKLIISENLLIFKEVNKDDFGEYVCDINTYENVTITIKLKNISKPDRIPFEYLIPLILLAILFLFCIMVITYLVYTGRKQLPATQDNVNGERDNEGIDIYEMVERNPKNENTYEPDNIYTDLNTIREMEPTYQGLIKQGGSGDSIHESSATTDKGYGDKEKTEASNIYEPLDLDCKTKV